MRRRTRGRGSSRGGARGGTGLNTAFRNGGSSTTVLGPTTKTTVVLSSAFQRPYIREPRGGLNRSVKSAINSIMSENDIMNNNHTPPTSSNLPKDETDGIKLSSNAVIRDGYLHKKFKKISTTESNGIIQKNSSPVITKTNEYCQLDKSLPKAETIPTPSVYKPKFRISTTIVPDLIRIPSTQSNSIQKESFELPKDETKSLLERKLELQSLDDRISQIINQNQSILSTWPEHLTKRSKGNGGRYSLGSRSGHGSCGMGFESSTSKSIDMESTNPKIENISLNKYPRSMYELNRSNSDMTHQLLYGIDEGFKLDNSFTIPKKRRRLSPLPGILSGGEVSELHNVPEDKTTEMDLRVRLMNHSGNSSTGTLIRTPPISSPHSIISNDEEIKSDNLIPKDLIMESCQGNSFGDKKRGRHSKTMEESSKIRKVVEKLQLHLNEKLQIAATTPSINLDSTKVPLIKEQSSLLADNLPTSSSLVVQATSLNPKRPNFLALKPNNPTFLSKKGAEHLTCILPSPETPRGAKKYNQLHINGNAYTYLGFKISTKPSYTCLFKPQPMFVPQETDPKLSMYSNWQPRPKDPNEDGKLSSYDSRVNCRRPDEPLYTIAEGNNFDTQVINSAQLGNICTTIMFNSLDESTQDTTTTTITTTTTTTTTNTTTTQLNNSQLSHYEDINSPPESPSLPNIDDESPSSNQSICSSIDPKSLEPVRFRKKSVYVPPCTKSLVIQGNEEHSSITSSEIPSKGRSISLCIDIRNNELSKDTLPLSLVSGTKDRQRSISLSSPSPENSRVKIMEGGFESNEAYTYIRGRGRGRYVCESCGIRCKKPSMLRKHLKTHTDLRPYTCKLCNFSFKTKGNLTKHQKSKSHHKKCMTLGIHPESSRSLEMSGPISDDDGESDDDDDEDMDDDNDTDSTDSLLSINEFGNDKKRFEKEIALSLLDLSQSQRLLSDKSKNSIESSIPNLISLPQSKHESNQSIDSPIDLSLKLNSHQVTLNEIVEEPQKWEPAEQQEELDELLKLKKVLNESENNLKIESSPEELFKEDSKPFEYEIIKRRISNSSYPTAEVIQDEGLGDYQLKNSSVIPKRLHQPWLSPELKEGESGCELDEIGNDKSNERDHLSSTILPTIDTCVKNSLNPIQVFGGLIKPQAEFRQPNATQLLDEGKAECNVCGKVFARATQLILHMNIHYLERPFRCEPCGISFRTKGHLVKHRRSSSHDCKVYLNEAWGVANEENPRPFKCTDCKIAFRIHGHLAKHLRSKMHIMKMECLGKLPFGIYVEMEKSGLNLNEIDTTDCDMSLVSLQGVALKIYGVEWREKLSVPIEEPL